MYTTTCYWKGFWSSSCSTSIVKWKRSKHQDTNIVLHEKGLESRKAYTSRYANSLASKVRNTVDQPRTMPRSIRQSSKADRPVVTVLKLHVTGWPVYPFPTHTISPRLTRSHPKHLHQLPVKVPSSTTHCIHHRNRRKQSKVGCKNHR